ncbi:hypothetical protein T05_3472 [Trichinella murrelli]|uniref:Uncharacterized protein n=1 Tax=Trichinella murrelli TaxID=144512 RepID=A0A0V0UAB9_9BILA|nr:hypothetical protein T05_3472 [Trichinella murrelli]
MPSGERESERKGNPSVNTSLSPFSGESANNLYEGQSFAVVLAYLNFVNPGYNHTGSLDCRY